jgi:hypothetical protein
VTTKTPALVLAATSLQMLLCGESCKANSLSRLEAGGVIPTIPLLDRISAALDADVIVEIAPHAA